MSNTKIRGLFLLVGLPFMMIFFDIEAMAAEKRIGILKYTEEYRFLEAEKAFIDQIKKDGIDVKFTVASAGGSKYKVSELTQKFADEKLDMVFALGTSATIAVSKVIKDVPIVFSIVYDPVEAGISKSWKSSGNNTTGMTTKISPDILIKYLKEIAPIKKVAVLYTPGERQTEIQLIELQKMEATYQIKIVPVILSKDKDAALTLPHVARSVDAIYLSGSSIVSNSFPLIMEIATKQKVVTITHLDDMVNNGALLGICANSYIGGQMAAEKALKILKGAQPSSIPIETPKKLDFFLNMKTAQAGEFQIPPSFMKKVTRTIE
jgi:putative tryptophan/tyrosine transport system substrate-binding protein